MADDNKDTGDVWAEQPAPAPQPIEPPVAMPVEVSESPEPPTATPPHPHHHLHRPKSRLLPIILVLTSLLTTIGAGVGAYMVRDKQANSEVAALKQENEELTAKVNKAGGADSKAAGNDLGSAGADNAPKGDAAGAPNTNFSSANIGFSLEVPKEWSGKWRYNENAAIGISSTSVTFYLINKDLKYAEVVSVAKIPEDKYNDARASGQAVGNPENLIKIEKGHAYVMAFANSVGDYKDFKYADATKAAKESIKASFKLL